MVIKTELCDFSSYRIYPGNGKLFIRRDGKPLWFGSSKAASLTMQNKKPAKLVWTQSWRIRNKKGLTDIVGKKRARKVTKIQRAFVGVDVEELKKRQSQSSAVRAKAQADALKKMGRGIERTRARALEWRSRTHASLANPFSERVSRWLLRCSTPILSVWWRGVALRAVRSVRA